MPFVDSIYAFDVWLLELIQKTMKCEFMDYVMAFFSYIGEYGGVWIITAIILLCFRKTRPTGVMIICAVAIGHLFGVILLKNIVERPRPFELYTSLQLNIKAPSDYSFPSGHSCASFAAATVIFARHKRYGIPALAAAFLIAFSRLYNCVHFPTDVICGALLGVICAAAVVIVFKKTGLDTRLAGDLKYKGKGGEKNG